VQVLDHRPETQVQLLALCNDLTAADCQIIWTSRNSPGELAGFPRKLVSRFRAGVLAALQAPELQSRVDLLKHFSEVQRLAIDTESAELLAEGLAVSPRELWAAVTEVGAFSKQERRAVDSDLVRRFLRQEVAPARLRLDDICRAVARQFGISMSQLRSRKQSRGVVLPRQCAMLLSRKLSGRSFEQIGRYFGGRDHSTVIHACRRLKGLIPQEADLRLNLSQIEASLTATEQAHDSD
jgi:chromosomal replication initiator protein